jgi:hypothetical protein
MQAKQLRIEVPMLVIISTSNSQDKHQKVSDNVDTTSASLTNGLEMKECIALYVISWH